MANGDAAEDSYDTTAPVYVWLGLIALSAVSFWAQAVITEERFVPCLNVLATRYRIRDDVAGATLMAAGASSPELLASFTTLFITHTSLGIGTIVGSEIFNQLMICAGSILSARNTELHLSKATVFREVFFYGLSLAFLMIALSDRRDDGSGMKRIFIQWEHGLLLFGGYLAYVIVCAYSEPLLECVQTRFGIMNEHNADGTHPLSPVADTISESPSMDSVVPFLRLISDEPSTNFHSAGSTDDHETEQELYPQLHDHHTAASSGTSVSGSQGGVANMLKFLVAPTKPKPSTIHGLEDRIWNQDGSFSCFLWERSLFYTKARVNMNAWQLRWFTFRRRGITSVPNRTFCKGEMRYPDFGRTEVDEAHLVLKMYSPGTQARDYIFMAPSEAVLLSVLDACQHMEHHCSIDSRMAAFDTDENLLAASASSKAEVPPPLTKFPAGESRLRQFFHILLFPLMLLMQITVPDPRTMSNHAKGPRLSTAMVSICLCIVWLIVGSYFMVTFLERLGDLMHLPDAVVGQTISAAGTSLPNFVASRVAARQGLGNMAVSNAFGSNTFNIFVGLGLPWLLYTLMFGEYSGLQDDGITESVLILVAVLVAFVLLILLSNFVLYKWHAYLFLIIYASYVIWVVMQGYKSM